MTAPAVGQPFYTPGSIVNDAAGHSYQANAQGQLIPVSVTPIASPGNPGQPQVGQVSAQVPQQQSYPQVGNGNQQQQQQPGISPNTVLRGPGIPAELQGRTFGEALQIYGSMRSNYGNTQQAQAQQQPQAQQPAPQQPNGQPAPMDPRKFYENPEGNTRRIIEETLRSTLAPMLQPVLQQTAQSAAQAAQAEFLRSNPGAQQHLAEMSPMLARSTPEQLANTQTWDAVYNYVLGQKVRQAEANMQPAYTPQPPQQQQNMWPERNTPMGQFFSESSSPSPAALGADPRGGASSLNQQELHLARAAGLTPEQYATSKSDLAAGRMPGFGPGWGTGAATPGNGGWNNGGR